MAAKIDFSKPFEAMRSLDDIPDGTETKKIGIYIACHGELIERTVTGPPTVTIHKQNLGGYGCSSYKVREPSDHRRMALLLENELVGCSLEDYQEMDHGVTDKHGRVIDKEGACERFSSINGQWVLKKYTYDETKRAFIIAFQGKTINMLTCTRQELEEFIGGNPARHQKTLDAFFAERGTNFDTQLLFNLIHLFSRQGVTVANILDESCNLHIKKRIVPKEQVFSRGNRGYGGKRTKRVHRFYSSSKKS